MTRPSSDSSNVPILTVSQLTQAIKISLETTFPFICLQGEISNFKLQSSGHLYFSLKDSQAQISVVMFRGDAATLKNMPKAGDHVIVKGALNLYPAKGGYQLIVRELSYMGLGELLQKLEQLKIKLHRQGWFKSTRKKPIPKFPTRIGVVTSPTGAVIQDILTILTRRFSGFHLILNPVKVQGEGAAREIADAIRQFNQHKLVDVMIVGRGGGSIEDLWAFNEEIVAEAIYQSEIPIISAVGHETDHCIADYVADARAPTPSAAAEIVIQEKNQCEQYMLAVKKRMRQTIVHLIQKERYRLQSLTKHPLFVHPLLMIEERMQRLDDRRNEIEQATRRCLQLKKHRIEICLRQALALKPAKQLAYLKQKILYWDRTLSQSMIAQLAQTRHRLDQKKRQIEQACAAKIYHKKRSFDSIRIQKGLNALMERRINLEKERLNHIISTLKAVDPKNLLNKGYSILFSENKDSVINSVHKLKSDNKHEFYFPMVKL